MKHIFLLIITVWACFQTSALSAQDSLRIREYQVNIYNQLDLRNSSDQGIAANRILHDVFRKNIKTKMPEKLGNISYGLYSFATTYLTMLWSHEFGHSMRAKQVGGEFRIHNANLPIPYTTMHLPSDINYVDEALSVTGGFEVNYLSVRKLQQEYISNNSSYNEDLAFSFANRMLYPIYTSLIVPINPEERDVWINTAGDPVHCILPVFKNYANNKVFMDDESVNPELVSLYKQSAILGLFFNFLDPNFYSELGATFGDGNKKRIPKFLIGNHENGWTYGTMFNVSPLGYELYFNNYLHLKGNQFKVYTKYGNPFKNNGIGAIWLNMYNSQKMDMSLAIDLWDQDIFGKGIAGEAKTNFTVYKNLDLNVIVGYKTNGYVIGKQIDAGMTLGAGITFRTTY